jgi:LPXTG-motif cell wall-anchored protein
MVRKSVREILAGTTTSATGVVALPGNDDAGGQPSWAWPAAGAGLFGLGGLAARRRFRRRSAGAAA